MILLIIGVILLIGLVYISITSTSTPSSTSQSPQTPKVGDTSGGLSPPPPPIPDSNVSPPPAYSWVIDNSDCDCSTGYNRYKCVDFNNVEISRDKCDSSKLPQSRCMTDMFCKPYDISQSDIRIERGYTPYKTLLGYTIIFPPLRGAVKYTLKLIGKTTKTVITRDSNIPQNTIVESLTSTDPNYRLRISLNTVEFESSVYKSDVYDIYLIGENTNGTSNPVAVGVLNLNYKYTFSQTGCDCNTGVSQGDWWCNIDEPNGDAIDVDVCRRMGIAKPPVANCYPECPVPSPVESLEIVRNRDSVSVKWRDNNMKTKNITRYTVEVYVDNVLAQTLTYNSPFGDILQNDFNFRVDLAGIAESRLVGVDVYNTNSVSTTRTSLVSQPVQYSVSDKICDCKTYIASYRCLRNGEWYNGITSLNGSCPASYPGDAGLRCSKGCPITLQPPQNMTATRYFVSGSRALIVGFDSFVDGLGHNDLANYYMITVTGTDLNGYPTTTRGTYDRQSGVARQSISAPVTGMNMNAGFSISAISYYGGITDSPIESVPNTLVLPEIPPPKIQSVVVGATAVRFNLAGIQSGISYRLDVQDILDNDLDGNILYFVTIKNGETYYDWPIGDKLQRYTTYSAKIYSDSSNISGNVYFRLPPEPVKLNYYLADVQNENFAGVDITTPPINYIRVELTTGGRVLTTTDVDVQGGVTFQYRFNVPVQYGSGTYEYRIYSGYRRVVRGNTIDVVNPVPTTFTVRKRVVKWETTGECVCNPYSLTVTDTTGNAVNYTIPAFNRRLACNVDGTVTTVSSIPTPPNGTTYVNTATCDTFNPATMLVSCSDCPPKTYNLVTITGMIFQYTNDFYPNIPNFSNSIVLVQNTQNRQNLVSFIPDIPIDKSIFTSQVWEPNCYFLRCDRGYLYVDEEECSAKGIYPIGSGTDGYCRSIREVKHSTSLTGIDPNKYKWVYDSNSGAIANYFYSLQDRSPALIKFSNSGPGVYTSRMCLDVGPLVRFSRYPV